MTPNSATTTKAQDQRARRAAKRAGFRIAKSRDRITHLNNRGGYQLVNGNNIVVDGVNFGLSWGDVVMDCRDGFLAVRQ